MRIAKHNRDAMTPCKRTLSSALVVTAALFGPSCGSHSDGTSSEEQAVEEASEWTCSMDPQVRRARPGKCPICFMDLIPLLAQDARMAADLPLLELSPAARALAEIETAPVELRSVAHEIEMVGKIAIDETRLAYITTRVPGRLERLFVDYTGVSVRKGDHLVSIYSPILYAAQQELLQAIETAGRVKAGALEVIRETTERTIDAARSKLRLHGLSEEQVREIEERGTPGEYTTIYAPSGGVVIHKDALEGMYVEEGTPIYTIADLTKVWVQLEAYESDLAWLRYGQRVEFRVRAYPGEVFEGRVAFINPVLNDATRTVKVRLNVDNSELRFKPAMFVSASAEARLTSGGAVVDHSLDDKWMCPMHPEVISDAEGACYECGMPLDPTRELGFAVSGEEEFSLVIPDTAPLITGKRAVVYVAVEGAESTTYEGRVISLGPRAGDRYVVLDGLEQGMQVVVKGAFKLDSELQIRARPSMMTLAPPEPKEARALHRVPARFLARANEVLDAYLVLQAELSADRDGAQASATLNERIGALDPTDLSGSAETWWTGLAPDLRARALSVADAADIEARRAALGALSETLIQVVEGIGTGQRDSALGVFHCPMAFDFEGADWMQLGEQVRNPYFGEEMLRCGTRQRVLAEELPK